MESAHKEFSMVPIVYPITFTRVNARLPVFPLGIEDWWYHSEAFLSFFSWRSLS